MTSELRVDNLKGSTTGGSINVLGEGTSATTNLQQGLCKAWCRVNMSTPAYHDSFNLGTITDNGTGDYSNAFTNNFGNVFYGWGGNGEVPSDGYWGRQPHCISDNNLTGSSRFACGISSGKEDCDHVRLGYFGDLA